jgi:transcriptional regulator with XRE-family HTH domain
MSRLLAIIDAYKDAHGQPSDASIARAVGVAPQTISSWRKRGIRELPARDTLARLADFMRVPYDQPYPGSVLEAALIDTGYAQPQPEPPREVGGHDRPAAM